MAPTIRAATVASPRVIDRFQLRAEAGGPGSSPDIADRRPAFRIAGDLLVAGASGPGRSLGGEKQAVGRIVALVPIGVAERVQRLNEPGALLRLDLDAREDASVVGAVIAVVEQRNVPIGCQA